MGMKYFVRLITITSFLLSASCQHANEPEITDQKIDESSIHSVASQHEQIYENSCIPMAVEMVLKFNKAEAMDYYQLQNNWQNKLDGTFQEFGGKSLGGLTFHHQFAMARDDQFPLDSLFQTIDLELAQQRKVIISLPSGYMFWHMYVIDKKTGSDEYQAYSRVYNNSNLIITNDVKKIVRSCQGTDILTYTRSH